MTCEVEIGGVRFRLDLAAISAIRYRAEYGDSVLNDLATCGTVQEAEGRLLRMCHCMIPEADRPELLTLAALARKDQGFFAKAQAIHNALLAGDPQRCGGEKGDGEPFDEYKILALMAAARMDMSLIYELPIMHIVGIVGRCFELQRGDAGSYHEMDAQEMAMIYPR